MEVAGSDQESTLFQAFIVPPLPIENRNVNKINDPIKQSNVPKASSYADDSPPSDVLFERFEQFTTLPIGLGKYVAPDLIGTPLEDIDPFYKDQQTFIVINRNKDLFRFSASKSLWLFRPNNLIRHTATRVLTHPFWAIFLILILLANCFFTLVIRDDNIFIVPWQLIIFSVLLLEFVVKVLSRGFVLDKFTYLRDQWNYLDILLIIMALISICIDPEEAIYYGPILGELRVLKICSVSLSLRRTISIYWRSLVKLRDLLLYILFIIIVISVLCVQMYMGVLTQHCVKNPLNIKDANAWASFTSNSANFFYEGGMHRACGNSSGAQKCPTNYLCLSGNNLNPNYGITSFDTALRSFFVVLRLIQRDFWEETMQYLTATAGIWHILLFIALIYDASFQLCSLLWTPIALAYNHLKDEQWENDLLNDLKEAKRESSEAAQKVNNAGCCAKFQRIVFNIIYNPFAVLFIILCILFNTLFMALDHHDMHIDLYRVLSAGNIFFVAVFVIEAILKLTALGPVQYFRDEWNTFDFIVTALGVIELSVENVQGLSVLRAFRLLRPLRLGKIVPAFDLLMKRIRQLFTVLRNQTIIVCMFIYIFVVFGTRSFAKNYIDNVQLFYGAELPRWNFTDTFHSFIVAIRLLCGEWVESLYDCMLVSDASSIVYFAAFAFIGSFVIMHLFVALILTNDDSSVLASTTPESSSSSQSEPVRKFNLHTYLKEKLLEPNLQKIYDANKPINTDVESKLATAASTTIILQSKEPDDKHRSMDDKKHTVSEAVVAAVVVTPVAASEDEDKDEDATINKWSKIRVKALKFNESTYFGYIVLVIICIGSVALVRAVNSSSLAPAGTSLVVELAFCIVMIIEFISKSISCGWKSYFKSIWCLIDLFNTIVVATTITGQSLTLFNSLAICAAFWLIFAIMGVQMFAGKFYHCVDGNQTRLAVDLVPDKETCLVKKFIWTNSPVNFDNVIEAYLSLLQVATFKEWIRIIQDATDSRDVDSQPVKESQIYMFLYFVIFIVLGVFICANLIVGILVKHILQNGNVSKSTASCDERTHTANISNFSCHIANSSSAASKLVALATNVFFEWIALILCLVYITSLSFDRYYIAQDTSNIIRNVNFVCAILFLIETALRLNSQRKTFLLQFWNFYDSVTVIFLLLELFMVEFGHSTDNTVKLLRVIRVLRFNSLLAAYSPELKMGFGALRRSAYTAINLCLFQLLIIYVYALIGVVVFKRVENIIAINDKISFFDVNQAITLLIQLSTTAGWDNVYNALIHEGSFSRFLIFIYLWSFLFICILTIVNLVLTIILNFYNKTNKIEYDTKK